MNKKVYVVASGEYSYFTIHAVFTDAALANHAVDRNRGHGEDWYVEVYVLDPPIDRIPAHIHRYRGRIKEDGTAEAWVVNDDIEELENEGMPRPTGHWNPRVARFMFTVYARSQEHAIRQAREIRALMIANDVYDYTGLPYSWTTEASK